MSLGTIWHSVGPEMIKDSSFRKLNRRKNNKKLIRKEKSRRKGEENQKIKKSITMKSYDDIFTILNS